MEKQPLVSIITPAYKAEPYIGQAIESVLAQTIPDWELIIVDDCSPDNTAKVVQRYLGDPRIKLLRNEQNIGEAASRNRALEAVQGEWITLLDADDWYEPQRLERLLQVANETGEQVVIDLWTKYEQATGKRTIDRVSSVYPNPKVPQRYDVYQFVYGHVSGKPLFRRALIQRDGLRYIPGVLKGPDYIFNIQLVYRAGSMLVTPDVLYVYRRHPSSVISQTRADLSQTHRLYEVLTSIPEVQQDARLRQMVLIDYQHELRLQCVDLFHRAIMRSNWREAHRIYRETPEVVKLYPNFLKRRLLRRLGLLSDT